MEWYNTLDIQQKINLKDYFKLICGYSFEDLGGLFSLSERIELIHQKLKLEGFTV